MTIQWAFYSLDPRKLRLGISSFEVELVNRSGAQLSQLRVIDYFDKGLSHAVSISPIEQAEQLFLQPGLRRLTLEFQVVELEGDNAIELKYLIKQISLWEVEQHVSKQCLVIHQLLLSRE